MDDLVIGNRPKITPSAEIRASIREDFFEGSHTSTALGTQHGARYQLNKMDEVNDWKELEGLLNTALETTNPKTHEAVFRSVADLRKTSGLPPVERVALENHGLLKTKTDRCHLCGVGDEKAMGLAVHHRALYEQCRPFKETWFAQSFETVGEAEKYRDRALKAFKRGGKVGTSRMVVLMPLSTLSSGQRQLVRYDKGFKVVDETGTAWSAVVHFEEGPVVPIVAQDLLKDPLMLPWLKEQYARNDRM